MNEDWIRQVVIALGYDPDSPAETGLVRAFGRQVIEMRPEVAAALYITAAENE